jgi:hypothetical protein
MVQGRLGHATIAMTADRYGHLFPRGDDGAELAAAERAFLGGCIEDRGRRPPAEWRPWSQRLSR